MVDLLDPCERMLVQHIGFKILGVMTHAERLQRHWSEKMPFGRAAHFFSEPSRAGHIPSQTRLEARHTLLANQEPELERTKAASERQPPVAEVLYSTVGRRLQIAWLRRHHANQVLGVAH